MDTQAAAWMESQGLTEPAWTAGAALCEH